MVGPEEDALVSFALRDLAISEAEAEAIAAHLDECAACRQAVRAGVQAAPTDEEGLGGRGARGFSAGTPSAPTARDRGTAIGARIGRYEVRRLLGAGGMGRVYVAYDAELDREIALKVLRPELAGRPDVLAQRLLRESRLTAKITHPAVMTVYDVGRADDVVFIAMELVHGETLGAFVARTRPGWRTCVAMYERAAYGLAAAHAAGIVHRDFKPENVLVELAGDRRVIVSDFGIARAIGQAELDSSSGTSHQAQLTATGAAIGTPAYMAPEQLAGGIVDLRADIYAFAVSLWEAIFGTRPPAAPTKTVPRRLLRALERGLEREPEKRWPDLPSFAKELAAIRGRRRRLRRAAIATGLVAAGIAGALVLTRTAPGHPCERGFDVPYDRAAVVRVLGADPASASVLASLDANAVRFRVTQAETCIADRVPAQAPTITTCLDARRIEIAGVTADIIADGPAHALAIAGLISAPDRCATPSPGLQFSRVPEDAVLRRTVTALRYRAFDAEATRTTGDAKLALVRARAVADDAAQVWPPLAAETLYLLGVAHAQGGNVAESAVVLKKAAALAEASHHDYIAAQSWIQLVMSATGDEGDPKRGLEYATYAEAALDRLGRPPDVDVLFQYAKGAALIEVHDVARGEVMMRRAVKLAERSAPRYLPQAIQGLGYLYESQGRTKEAIAAYRDALAHLPGTGTDVPISRIMFEERLAVNLGTLGQSKEAVAIALAATQLADAQLGVDNLERALVHVNYAQCLGYDEQLDAAILEIDRALGDVKRIAGDRSQRYGEVLMTEGYLLVQRNRYQEAEPKLARACDVIAFADGEGSEQQAECWQSEAGALSGLHRDAEALALIDKSIGIASAVYGKTHPKLAQAIVIRGEIHATMKHHRAAIRDFETAIALYDKLDDPGHSADASYSLALELAYSDHARAREVMQAALARFESLDGGWSEALAAAKEWLATDGHPVAHSGL